MTPIEMEDTSTERTQRTFARVAGFLFLWLIIAGLAGALTVSPVVGSGTFAETAKGVVASIDAGIDLAKVTRYELQVKIQPSEEHLTASAQITLSNPTAAPLREIPFCFIVCWPWKLPRMTKECRFRFAKRSFPCPTRKTGR